MLRTLLRLHRTELRNRLRAGGAPTLALAGSAGGAIALGAAVWAAGARAVGTASDVPGGLTNDTFDRTFWLCALVAFVMGFTTFEALYRSPGGRRLESLPVPGRVLFVDRLLALTLWHLPLLLLALVFHAPLVGRAPRLFAYAAVVHTATWTLTLAVGTWLHVAAGRTLLSGGSSVKEFLGGGFHTNDAALVLYSPAAAFAAAVFGAVPIGLFARPLALEGMVGSTLAILAAVAVVSAVALFRAGAIYARGWRFIRARFTEAEVLRPWREHDLPRQASGAFAERWFAPPLRGLYHKDLLQLRRRHRVDLTLVVVAAIGFALFHMRTALPDTPLLLWDAALLLAAVGAVLTPVYKLAGRELEPEGFLRALPVPLGAVRRSKALVALTHQVPLALAMAFAWLVATMDIVGFLALLVGGIAVGFALSSLYLRLAIGRRRPGPWLGWAFRGAVLAAALVTVNLG